ncbi:MAG: hypothetical protein ACJ705_04985 [Nitrososphaeraceae archaeon]
MYILHIGDQAGVDCILAKYQQRLQGHEAKVITVRDYDKYGINAFYNEYTLNVELEEFVEKYIEKAKQADVLHTHGGIDILLKLPKV